MPTRNLITLILLLLTFSCVEPVPLEETSPPRMLVVEGVFSDQLKQHKIQLSHATPINTKIVAHETGATVTISDDNGGVISLTEESPGQYLTPEISADPERAYTLHVITAGGREYASSEVPFQNGPEIKDVYAKYLKSTDKPKGIQFYVDTEDPSNKTHFYRWNYIETYEVHAPLPSNWVWLGGQEVTFRLDGIDTCYVTDTLRQVILRDTRTLEEDKIVAQPIRFIPEKSYIMRYKFSILVQQFCLSEEAYSYWDNLRKVHEEQGSLSDLQPGSLRGNIMSTTDPDETVLGYFEACKVSEKRMAHRAIDFYKEGFLTPKGIRSNCNDLIPIEVPQADLEFMMTKHEGSLLIWEVSGMSPYAVFYLYPRECCDCRDHGPTVRPPFF